MSEKKHSCEEKSLQLYPLSNKIRHVNPNISALPSETDISESLTNDLTKLEISNYAPSNRDLETFSDLIFGLTNIQKKSLYSLQLGRSRGYALYSDENEKYLWSINTKITSTEQREVLLVKSNNKKFDTSIVLKHTHLSSKSQNEKKARVKVFRQEIWALKTLSHPCVVQLLNYYVSSAELILVENYCMGGDLYHYTKKHHSDFSLEFVGRIFSELVHTVAYLHSKCLIHRDLKLESKLDE